MHTARSVDESRDTKMLDSAVIGALVVITMMMHMAVNSTQKEKDEEEQWKRGILHARHGLRS